MANELAEPGQIFVCTACGKTSVDRYGDLAIDPGWDESCMLHAVLCYADKKFDASGILSWHAVNRPDHGTEI